MPLVFRVSNTGAAAVTLPLQGREPTADFRVFDTRDRQIWSRLRGQIVLGSLRLYPLGARDTLTFRHVWDQRGDTGGQVPPGDYLVRGVLITDAPGGMVSGAFRLRIEPPPRG